MYKLSQDVDRMTIEKLKRVVWRLKEIRVPDNVYSNKQIRRAIMEEIGVDERTITRTLERMLEFKMIEKAEFGNMRIIFEE